MHLLTAFLRVHDIPRMARPNYAAEMRHTTLWGLFANLIDGSFSSIVVAKTFGVPVLIPIVWATPMLAHLFSFVWGIVVRGQPKVRTFVILAACAIAGAGSIAFTPSDWYPWGGWLFAAQIAWSRIFLSGLVTVRTSMWKSNYPHSHRARIAARIQALNAFLLLVIGAAVSLLFDQHAEYYRLVYPALAFIGVCALLPLRRIRVRRERSELRRLRAAQAPALADGRVLGGLAHSVREAASILRRDRAFARYCTAQYLLGSANFMVDPVLTVFVTQSLKLGYFSSYLLMEQIPTILSVLTIHRWAPLFDRVGVLRFRVVNSAFWLGSVLLAGSALFLHKSTAPFAAVLAIGVLVLARVINGVGRGGGAIAWNLGHLHFAGRHDAELYMGIHVALTGLRGLIMPFVGAALYQLVGPVVMLLGVILAAAAVAAFHQLARNDTHGQTAVVVASTAAEALAEPEQTG